MAVTDVFGIRHVAEEVRKVTDRAKDPTPYTELDEIAVEQLRALERAAAVRMLFPARVDQADYLPIAFRKAVEAGVPWR